jgi:hypothetical protein
MGKEREPASQFWTIPQAPWLIQTYIELSSSLKVVRNVTNDEVNE